jgi:hypothetical protein
MAWAWTEQERIKLREIRAENKLSLKEAAEILKRPVSGVKRKARDLGIGWSTVHKVKCVNSSKSHKPTREQASSRIYELHTKGATMREIASVLHMSHAHIKTIMATLGIAAPNVTGGMPPPKERSTRITHRAALPAFDPVALAVLHDAGLPIKAP